MMRLISSIPRDVVRSAARSSFNSSRQENGSIGITLILCRISGVRHVLAAERYGLS